LITDQFYIYIYIFNPKNQLNKLMLDVPACIENIGYIIPELSKLQKIIENL